MSGPFKVLNYDETKKQMPVCLSHTHPKMAIDSMGVFARQEVNEGKHRKENIGNLDYAFLA